MAMGIVTGYTGSPHVTAMDDKIRNATMLSYSAFVFDVGERLEAEKQSDSVVRIKSGSGIVQGVQFSIQPNDYEDVSIDNGTIGYNRYDYIVARYQKNNITSVESVSLVALKGEPFDPESETPTYPTLLTGDILAGDLVKDVLLYKVNIVGTAIVGIERKIDIYPIASINASWIDEQWDIIWNGA